MSAMIVRTLAALAVAATALGVSACGGDPSAAASSDRQAQTKQALLDYARCMRQHGVDMPDPQFSSNGGNVRISVGGRNGKASDQTMRTAQAACQHFQEEIKPPNLSDQEKEQHRQEALAYSRCMREHGIDFPDPQFNADGGMKLSLSQRVHPDSPAFKAADKACASKRPGGGGPGTTDVAP